MACRTTRGLQRRRPSWSRQQIAAEHLGTTPISQRHCDGRSPQSDDRCGVRLSFRRSGHRQRSRDP
eukprot:3465586-Pyramimonas_sp.AAC.1